MEELQKVERIVCWAIQRSMSTREMSRLVQFAEHHGAAPHHCWQKAIAFWMEGSSGAELRRLIVMQREVISAIQASNADQVTRVVTRAEVAKMMGCVLSRYFPLALMYAGDLGLLAAPRVAIVGSRYPTYYGRAQAFRFAQALAANGVTVVSGGAIGVDAIALLGGMKLGRACAVLGSGIEKLYPSSNRELFVAMMKKGGLVLSEFPADAPPQKWNFPRRNHTIAGLAEFVLVIEAAGTSGSLITANAALDINVDVGALPGPVDSEMSIGTNALIRNGAFCIHSPEDVMERLASLRATGNYRSQEFTGV